MLHAFRSGRQTKATFEALRKYVGLTLLMIVSNLYIPRSSYLAHESLLIRPLIDGCLCRHPPLVSESINQIFENNRLELLQLFTKKYLSLQNVEIQKETFMFRNNSFSFSQIIIDANDSILKNNGKKYV